ncbi:MAG: FAD-dependent oxidoreductase [Oscillospiraceae bacterium]|nr:FAD-dependent oxidoreductase [Oscillospiraceae bacterium]
MEKAYTPSFPALCSYLKVGKRTLRNRMCSAPMGFPDLTEDGCLTDGAIAFYEQRAKGGAAIVTISEACVDYAHGKSHGRLINLTNPGVLANLTNAARAIKRHGALASIELNHSGMLSEFDVVASERSGDGLSHWGPVDCVLPNGDKVVGMTKEMIDETVEKWAKGAALCKRAGFDMVMIHAGHGWLIHQFLSPLTNTRTDEYGGSFENRARLGLEIIEAVRRAVGPGFPIEVRFSAMEKAEGGVTLESAIAFAKLIESKVDILHVSAGGEPDFGVTHPSMFRPHGCNVHYAAEIKKHVSIPVATVGNLGEPEDMEKIISSGQADIVCMARALLADPFLPKKVEQNRTDEILRCIRCFVCHAERMLTQTRVCAINPVIGREYEARFIPAAPEKKRVLVAGGGPGGMQCALTAAERGHSVTLCEASDALGGSFRYEFNVPFKAAFPKYVATLRRRMEKAGVEIRLGTTVTPEFVREFAPDALMVAVGSEAAVPPIPGIDSPKVIFGTELDKREAELGRRIAVLGGGMVGCESGLHLAMKGHEVTVIERGDRLAPDANPRHRPMLMAELDKYTRIRTGLCAVAVTDEGLLCRDENGSEELIECDSILCAAGLRSRESVADALRGTAPIVEMIGDCVEPGIVRGATFRGYHAALDL